MTVTMLLYSAYELSSIAIRLVIIWMFLQLFNIMLQMIEVIRDFSSKLVSRIVVIVIKESNNAIRSWRVRVLDPRIQNIAKMHIAPT